MKCGSFSVVKRGRYKGKQRWYCKVCNCTFSGVPSASAEEVSALYRTGRLSATDISARLGISVRSVFRRLQSEKERGLEALPCEIGNDVVVLMDATYWGRNFGVVVMKDYLSGRVLWFKFIYSKERTADYVEGITYIEGKGKHILGLVADGLKGLRERFPVYPFQLCQFHMVQLIRLRLTRNPKSPAAQELLALSRLLAHTDKESFLTLFNKWEEDWGDYVSEMTIGEDGKRHHTHARLWSAYRSLKNNINCLWTFYDHPEARMPNTNNALEGLNSSIKDKLNRHKGVSREKRKVLIAEVLIAHKPNRNK